jgi:hypothetical protein
MDLLQALFEPRAQGTVRFLSERAFFLTFESLFGLEALPYRIFILALFAASCVLLAAVTRRLSGSAMAGVLAPMFWTISVGVAAAIGWASSTNQIFLAFFVLATFLFFLDRRPIASWTAYLLGFGALESMLMLPALLMAYALLYDRSRLRSAAWYLIPAGAFAWLHLVVIPKPSVDSAYQMHWGLADLAATAIVYWEWSAGSMLASALLGLLLVAAVSWRAANREWTPLFGLLWFALLLAPVLPLRDHTLHYYLAAPVTGLAIALAAVTASLLKQGWIWRLAAVAAAGLFAAGHVTKNRETIEWNREKSRDVRQLVRGVERARQLHPRASILLDGISDTLFWDGIFDNPFRILGIDRVYLAPGAEQAITEHQEWGGINRWVIPPASVRELFRYDAAVVYRPEGELLVNVTGKWRDRAARLGEELSGYVNVGDPAFDRQLGDGWFPIHNRSRWMGRRATVRLSTRSAAGGELVVSGWCPAGLVAAGPVELEILADGRSLGKRKTSEGDALFELSYPLANSMRGRDGFDIELRLSRTFRPPEDGRDLGFVLGTIQIR